MPFHQGNMMSNKPHLHPHQKKRQASLTTRLLVAILILAIFALVIALEATGHVVFRGRLILLRGDRWLLIRARRRRPASWLRGWVGEDTA